MSDHQVQRGDEPNLPVMLSPDSKQLELAGLIARESSDQERAALLIWAQGLLAIRHSDLSVTQKGRAAVELTIKHKVVWPVAKLVSKEIKRVTWDERSTKARFGLAGAAVGLALFGGQGAGIAALGGAIGVPLWIVLGAGGSFAGVLVEELSAHIGKTSDR